MELIFQIRNLPVLYGIRHLPGKGKGLFSVETVEEQVVWDKVIAEDIFVICKAPITKSIIKCTLPGFHKAKVNTRYFGDLINQINDKPENFVAKVVKGRSY